MAHPGCTVGLMCFLEHNTGMIPQSSGRWERVPGFPSRVDIDVQRQGRENAACGTLGGTAGQPAPLCRHRSPAVQDAFAMLLSEAACSNVKVLSIRKTEENSQQCVKTTAPILLQAQVLLSSGGGTGWPASSPTSWIPAKSLLTPVSCSEGLWDTHVATRKTTRGPFLYRV